MIKSVVRTYNWTPTDIESLYLDGIDFLGLEYWYDDAAEVDQEITAETQND